MTKREARIEALHVSSMIVRRAVDQDGLQCDYPEGDQDNLVEAVEKIADSLYRQAVRLEVRKK